jgi:hypothetical protein
MDDIRIVQSDLRPRWVSCHDRRHKVKYDGRLTIYQCADNCKCNATEPPRFYTLEIHTAQPLTVLEWLKIRSEKAVELYEYGPMTIKQLQECDCCGFKILSTTPVVVPYPVYHVEVDVDSIQSVVGFSYIESLLIRVISQDELDHISPTLRKLQVRTLQIWCDFRNPKLLQEVTLFRTFMGNDDNQLPWYWYQQEIEIIVSLVWLIQNRRLPLLLEHCHILKQMLWKTS